MQATGSQPRAAAANSLLVKKKQRKGKKKGKKRNIHAHLSSPFLARRASSLLRKAV
jgi:hypothetical protein